MNEPEDSAPPPAAAAKQSPDHWAEVLFPLTPSGKQSLEYWKHAAAEQLHGWRDHQPHEGKPMQLSQADYEAAIDAAISGDEPHEPALSKHHPLMKLKEND